MSANENDDAFAGSVPSPGETGGAEGRVPSHGVTVGPVPPPGETSPPPRAPDAGSGDPAYNGRRDLSEGPVPSPGVLSRDEQLPRRLRRLHRVWPDRDGNISYLLTPCTDGRACVLDNEEIFQRLVSFLLDSPDRYQWFGRRFVVMPDHIHVIAHMGREAVPLGQWIKALKSVVGGLKRRDETTHNGRPVEARGLQAAAPTAVGRMPSHGAPHEFTRVKRAWRWQDGYHDHKFRTPESESRKWEYVCLNPVRYGFVKRPEEWPYGGEMFYDDQGEPRLVRGTPSLLESGMLIAEANLGLTRRENERTPGKGTRPTA